jgi:hypothetical protein
MIKNIKTCWRVEMNTKIRISIWIVALFLVFSGITLSTRQVFAASSIHTTAGIIDDRGPAIAEFLASFPSSGVDLTTLNAVDAMAYRYTSMAKYFAEKSITQSNSFILSKFGATQPGQVQVYIGYGGVDLTTLSPVDAMAYRFTSLAYYYSTHPNAIR